MESCFAAPGKQRAWFVISVEFENKKNQNQNRQQQLCWYLMRTSISGVGFFEVGDSTRKRPL
jgi:hypothetical protein